MALTQLALPALQRAPAPTVVVLSSDAAVEAYPGWGGYGSAKAALDHVAAVLAAEHPDLRVYAFDPGDMLTAMHQAAFPGEDISDRPDPATVSPALLRLLDERPDSGRYRAADLLATPSDDTAPADTRAPASPCRPSWARPSRRSSAALARDEVRLLVAAADRPVRHTRFRDLAALPSAGRPRRGQHLRHPGRGRRRVAGDGRPVTVHVSHQVPTDATGSWSCARPAAAARIRDARAGEISGCPAG